MLLLSDNCYLKEHCYKYQKTDCECKHSNTYCPKLFRVNYLFDESLLTDKQRVYQPLYIDDDGTDRAQFQQLKLIESNIEDFVNKGANLFLHSNNCGNGKTAWSIRLLQTYINKIWHKSDLTCRVLFINVPRYLQAIKNNISNVDEYAEHIKKYVLKADLVVFDEVGTKAATTFEHENLLSIINSRIENNKSNIYTSNLNGEQLKGVLGERLYSRIVNLSTDIELFGKDKRGLV